LLVRRGLDVNPAAHYLYSYRILAWLPYEMRDGVAYMAGEDTYTEGPPMLDNIIELRDDELPDPLVH
jgi:hypothetical protein